MLLHENNLKAEQNKTENLKWFGNKKATMNLFCTAVDKPVDNCGKSVKHSTNPEKSIFHHRGKSYPQDKKTVWITNGYLVCSVLKSFCTNGLQKCVR
ncbi:hypothetical protein LSI01_09160 [Furfurilactobacillus siliginis]|uniref:Uncharacterized protein n=1 Tax=Furfurilactobacillus siliginis TaxID=348151 RepID=A0A510VUF8_9LACO|nr:hypothetical protein LSI01_09160 [Furfurilactobacillus siliginis]